MADKHLVSLIHTDEMKVLLLDKTLPERQEQRPEPVVTNGLSLIIPVLFALCLVVTILVRYRLIFFASPDIGGIESNVIYAVQRYMAGYPLYANPEVAPYSITQYSPLYYRLVAATACWTGVRPDELLSVYRVSRVVSLLANGLYALALYGLGNRLHLKKKIGLLVAVMAFVLLPPQAYSRPDSVYGLLVMATLYAHLRAIQSGRPVREYGWLMGSVVLAALAIATKQSGVVLPLLMTGYYAFLRGQWLKAIGLGVLTSILAASFLVGLMPEHDPVLLYANIVKGVNQGMNFPSFKINIIDHYFRTFSMYNAVGLPLCIWLMQHPKPAFRWLGWCVLVVFSFSLLSSLKWGSALNYFTEYVALTGIIGALWLDQWTLSAQAQHGVRAVLISAVCWAIVPNIPNFNWSLIFRPNTLSEETYYQQKKVADYLTDSLHLNEADAVFVTDYNYAYLNGFLFRHCIVPQQDMTGIVMYPQRKFDYRNLDKQISQRGIRFLITRVNEASTLFPDLIVAHFRFRRTIGSYTIYEVISQSDD